MPLINIQNVKTLSEDFSSLKKYTFEYENLAGEKQLQVREAYDRGNGMTALLYNSATKKMILTKQFRLPTFLNANGDGMMIEACAGKLEEKDPEKGMLREIEEETGYRLEALQKVYELYMSPGSVTEKIYFYVGEYREDQKVNAGGGLATEQENIEVLEVSSNEAFEMMRTGVIKDAKTVILLQYAIIHGLS